MFGGEGVLESEAESETETETESEGDGQADGAREKQGEAPSRGGERVVVGSGGRGGSGRG